MNENYNQKIYRIYIILYTYNIFHLSTKEPRLHSIRKTTVHIKIKSLIYTQ